MSDGKAVLSLPEQQQQRLNVDENSPSSITNNNTENLTTMTKKEETDKREEDDEVVVEEELKQNEFVGSFLVHKNGSDEPPKYQQQYELELNRQRFRAPILLDSRALQRAMSQKHDNLLPEQTISSLERFVQNQYLLSRLQPFFELALAEVQRRGERGKLNLPVKELNWSPQQGILTVTYPCYPIPINGSSTNDNINSPQPATHLIRMQLLICKHDFKLITKLDYSGFNCPAESDVRIFERFFSSQVVKTDNEMAVFSFISLCRFSLHSIFASLAQLMLVQMEPGDYPWRIELELLHTADEQQQNPSNIQQRTNSGQIMKNVLQSVMITDKHSKFLFIIYLFPNNIGRVNISVDRRRIVLCYHIESNELTWWYMANQQPNEFDQRVADTIKFVQSEFMNKQNEEQSSSFQRQQCTIWPCIRALLEGKHQ